MLKGSYSLVSTCTDQVVEEWRPPQQKPVNDEAELRALVDSCGRAAKAMEEFLKRENERTGNGDTVIYLPKLPGPCCNLAAMSTVAPVGTAADGTTLWENITEASWEKRILAFAVTSAFEIVDLQSDLTVCISLFTDDAYQDVPADLKILFAAVTAATCILEVALAVRATTSKTRGLNRTFAESTTTVMLNYLGTPVELMVAPFRFAPFGGNKLGRNIGSNTDHRNPLVMLGDMEQVPYLKSRQFIVRLPKVVLENIILFALTVYIQHNYIGKWTGAMLFSVFLSTLSLVLACIKTARFFKDARIMKRHVQKVLEEPPEACLQERNYEFAQETVKECPFTCPIL